MPHVPDTAPGKRVTDAGARTEGRGQPSNIRGGSRMQESCTYGSVRVAPCKRMEFSRLRWRPRQSLTSSRVPSLAWCPQRPLRSVDREGVGRNESERRHSPEIDRGGKRRPYLSWGRQIPGHDAVSVREASGVRTAGMQPKDFMGTREIHQVQAKACRTGQAGKARKVRRPVGSQTG